MLARSQVFIPAAALSTLVQLADSGPANAQVHVGVGRDPFGNRQVQVFVGGFGIPLVDVNVNSGRGVGVNVGGAIAVDVPTAGPALPLPGVETIRPLPAPAAGEVELGAPSSEAGVELGEPSTDAAEPLRGDTGTTPPPLPMQTTNYLGLNSDPLPNALAAQLANLLPERGGLLVTRVHPETPAAKAGIRENDILLAFDGKPLTSHEQLRELVQDAAPSATVEVELLRAAARMKLQIALTQRDVGVTPDRVVPGRIVPGSPVPDRAVPGSPARTIPPEVPDQATVIPPRRPAAVTSQPAPVAAQPAPIATQPGPVVVASPPALSIQRGPNTVSVSTLDGVTYHVTATFSDATGQLRQLELVGTQKQLVRQFHALPPHVQQDIIRSFY